MSFVIGIAPRSKFWNGDEAGFWLHYRRLERGRVQWPARGQIATQRTTLRQIQGLVDGWLSTNLKPIGLSGVGVLSDRNHHMSTTPA